MINKPLLIVAIVILGLSAGYISQRLSQLPVKQYSLPENKVPEYAPAFKLKDLEDKHRSSKEWQGKVMMVNFWASWCPPCIREIPAFIKLQANYASQGLVIVGIAIDNKQSIVDFTDPMEINYPVLMAEKEGIKLAGAFGNQLGALPYTAIIDRSGKIIYTHRGELSLEAAEKIIKPLL